MIEVDANDEIMASVASLKHSVDGNEVSKSVAYFSKKMTSAARNHDICDKGLLAIAHPSDEYRPKLGSTRAQFPVRVVCDHKNLEHFMFTQGLNNRQGR